MSRQTHVLAALLFGIGCSHAKPKSETPRAALAAAPRPAPAPTWQETNENASTGQARGDGGEAIYFDFDSALIKRDARPTLQEVGKLLAHNRKEVRIEGNCDERGTTEYNMALGDKRAREAEKYLERLGIPERRISIVTYGSERPKYPGHDETAWAKNRRDDFKIQ